MTEGRRHRDEMQSTERHNRMVWNRGANDHHEMWSLGFNHRPTTSGFCVGYGLVAPTGRRAAPQFKVTFAYSDGERPQRSVALSRTYPVGQLSVIQQPFQLDVEDARLSHDGSRGALTAAEHSALWDLRFLPASRAHHYVPAAGLQRFAGDTTLLLPNPAVHLDGHVTVNDRRFDLDGAPGSQLHLWGRKHPHAWARCHCSAFREDATALLEVLSLRLRRGQLVMPTVNLISLYLGSEVYDFRDIWQQPLVWARWETGTYRFRATGYRIKVEGELTARAEEMFRTELRDPDGERCYLEASHVADARVVVWNRRTLWGSFKQVCRLSTRGSAHLEFCRRIPTAEVTRTCAESQA